MTIAIRLLQFLLIGLLVTACAGTKMSDSWSSQSYKGTIKNVYIIGIAKNELNRMLFEDIFKGRLARENVKAISSYTDILTKQEATDRETIIQKMRSNGCDSVLLTRVVGQQKETLSSGKGSYQYSNGPYYGGSGVYNRPHYYRDWGTYYTHGRVNYVQPSSIDIVTLTVESVLYDLQTEELIWSARLETHLAKNIEATMQIFVDEVTKDLKGKGLL